MSIQQLDKMVTDISCITVIIYFIYQTYIRIYGKKAAMYIKNQLNIIISSAISCIMLLRLYYNIENKYHIDNIYTNGIILTMVCLMEGLLCEKIYKKYFYCKDSEYNATDEEYLFMVCASLIATSISLIAEGIMQWTALFVLLLGRFFWLDTKSIQMIRDMLKIKHTRVIESSLIFLGGMIIIAAYKYLADISQAKQIFIALFYGIFIVKVYVYFRKIRLNYK